MKNKQALTVRSLIEALGALPQDMEVLGGDSDGWFYNLYSAEVQRVKAGERVAEGGAEVVVLNTH